MMRAPSGKLIDPGMWPGRAAFSCFVSPRIRSMARPSTTTTLGLSRSLASDWLSTTNSGWTVPLKEHASRTEGSVLLWNPAACHPSMPPSSRETRVAPAHSRTAPSAVAVKPVWSYTTIWSSAANPAEPRVAATSFWSTSTKGFSEPPPVRKPLVMGSNEMAPSMCPLP